MEIRVLGLKGSKRHSFWKRLCWFWQGTAGFKPRRAGKDGISEQASCGASAVPENVARTQPERCRQMQSVVHVPSCCGGKLWIFFISITVERYWESEGSFLPLIWLRLDFMASGGESKSKKKGARVSFAASVSALGLNFKQEWGPAKGGRSAVERNAQITIELLFIKAPANPKLGFVNGRLIMNPRSKAHSPRSKSWNMPALVVMAGGFQLWYHKRIKERIARMDFGKTLRPDKIRGISSTR
ncbi:hypothetical protein Acr_03g0008340 [Actinidia rufa]|uniref:Uncharacterized protein n=1 Tax=Actinidia rufa TaxID=165716 RepID=A0A7J0ECE6_9ERIC|nr:hypothetical protein Acr_03g0008340 [Actinidia rufa]